jgi:hypothetical protein
MRSKKTTTITFYRKINFRFLIKKLPCCDLSFDRFWFIFNAYNAWSTSNDVNFRQRSYSIVFQNKKIEEKEMMITNWFTCRLLHEGLYTVDFSSCELRSFCLTLLEEWEENNVWWISFFFFDRLSDEFTAGNGDMNLIVLMQTYSSMDVRHFYFFMNIDTD